MTENGPSVHLFPDPEDIVITGMAGTFPASENIEVFERKLYNKVGLISPAIDRQFRHPDCPPYAGFLPHYDKFDAGFFGMHKRQAIEMSPQIRMTLEKTIECILDAGIHPSELENTNTGIFSAVCFDESQLLNAWWCQNENNMILTIHGRYLHSQKVGYFLKTKGPCFNAEAACASSFYALTEAITSLKNGECDQAIVIGSSLCLHVGSTIQLFRLGVLSPTGRSRPFDDDCDGYVRAEAVVVVLLQKAKDARRIYAQVVHAKTNCDGFKEEGIHFPSTLSQLTLLKEFYTECKIDPSTISYVEAHGTATRAGDPEECSAIDKICNENRDKPLLIGSVKSFTGHTEAASGLVSIVKSLLALDNELIPPNINYTKARKDIAALVEGKLQVVTETTKFRDNNKLIASNSFGFGGTNAHILLRGFKIHKNLQPNDNLLRLVCVSGRTEESVTKLLDDVVANRLNVEYVKLLHTIYRKQFRSHQFKGYVIVSKEKEITRSISSPVFLKQNLYIALGELPNWYEIINDFKELPLFNKSLKRIEIILKENSLDMETIINNSVEKRKLFHFLGQTIAHLCLVDVLKEVLINKADYVDNFMGTLISSYRNGVLKFNEIIEYALVLNKEVNKNAEVILVEYGHLNTNLLKLMKRTALHKPTSPRELILQRLWDILKNVTKYKEGDADDYFNKVIFDITDKNGESFKSNDVLFEIGINHFGFDLEDIQNLKFSYRIENFLKNIGSLYELGFEVALHKLYPNVEFPISSGSPRLNSKIRWKHNFEYIFNIHDKIVKSHYKAQFTIDLNTSEWNYLVGHNIDGRILFPAAGYLYLVWKLLSKKFYDIKNTPVGFEDCKFVRATTLNQKEPVVLKVSMNSSGYFEITESDSLVVTGKVSTDIKNFNLRPELYHKEFCGHLTAKDINKEFRLRGYNYSGLFRGIKAYDTTKNVGKISWNENFVTFLDNLFQLKLLQVDTRSLYVPIFLKKLTISTENHFARAEKNENPDFLATFNPISNIIRSGGIEIQGIQASSIPRKKNLIIPVLESYEFVPNHADLTVDQSVRVNIQIIVENLSINKISCLEIIDNLNHSSTAQTMLSPTINDALKDQPVVREDIKIYNTEPIKIKDFEVEYKDLKNIFKEYTLLVGRNLLNGPQDLEESLRIIKDNGYIISREDVSFYTACVTRSDISILTVHRTEFETMVLIKKAVNYVKPTFININQNDNYNWLPEVQNSIQTNQKLVLYSENEQESGLLGFVNCLRREPNVNEVNCFLILDKIKPFNPNDKFFTEQLHKNMAINIYKNGCWGTYRHLKFPGYENVKVNHSYVNQIVKGDLSSLRWMEGSIKSEECIRNSDKLFVNVHYSALNFKDVMVATGKISADVFTNIRMEQECVLGLEFSGTDSGGKRVMGMVPHAALSTIVKVDEDALLEVPEDWSMAEAATVPVVYATVIYALEMRALIQTANSILIHSGLGGIGQSAIRYCLYYGCTIFTTVGSEKRKKRLLEIFPELPESHIGNSHDTSFEGMIMKETCGRGVDIVLNSLAGEKLLASVRCLGKGGKFLEIGKFDLSQNNQLNLLLLKKSCSFHGISLDKAFGMQIYKCKIFDLVKKGMENGSVKPLELEIFKQDEIEQAFRHMASGKHSGKVLIEVNKAKEATVNGPRQFDSLPRYYCDPKKSYIIIGGLGGFGLELCDWLILRGAKNLVLVSRHGIKDGYQKMRIKTWLNYGVNVIISQANVSQYSECVKVVEEASNLGPVGGFFNLAVVLEDALIENQTIEKFKECITPKAIITKHFDKITRKLCPELSEFVIFSSFSCGRGNFGQTNYGMANSIIERMCENRKRDGYPALAIQWGAIGEVGLIAETQTENIEIEVDGTLQQKISSCLQVMDQFLRQKSAVIVSSMVVAEKRKKSSSTLVESVAIVLGVTDVKAISFTSTLAEIGMDSMAAVEIKQFLETDYEIFLTPKQIRSLTFARLEEFEKGNKSDELRDNEIPESSPKRINFINSLDRYRGKQVFNVPIVKMSTTIHDNQRAPTVLFLPGIEGFAEVFTTVCKELEANAYVLQQNYDDVPETIFDMAQQIFPYVEGHLSPKSKFLIVSYSYGTTIGLELVAILESKGYTGTLVCIDGSPVPIKSRTEEFYREFSSNFIENSIIFDLLTTFATNELSTFDFEMISKCQTTEDKFQVIKNSKLATTISLDDLFNLTKGVAKRFSAIRFYGPSFKKIKSRVVLYKPTSTIITSHLVDYGLGDLCDQNIEVKVFEGDHNTILENQQLIHDINKLL